MSIYVVSAMVVVSLVLIVYAVWPKPKDDGDTIKRRMAGRRSQDAVADVRKQAKESVAKKVMKTVTPMAIHSSMTGNAEDMSKLRMKLSCAGYRGENAPTTLLASKTIMAILFAIAAATYSWAKGDTIPGGMGITLIGAGLGFLSPNVWLSMAISKRQEKIRNGLPDTLDMLVISVESGLGLDSALQRVGDEMHTVHPTLAEEFKIVTTESQMGIPRSEALTNLAARTGLDEVTALVAIVNQAERFGTSIAKALRNQSDSLRVKRRQAAEERAQKTTVKLMAPLILFIFPAILIVLAGPAALKMIETLGNTPGLL